MLDPCTLDNCKYDLILIIPLLIFKRQIETVSFQTGDAPVKSTSDNNNTKKPNNKKGKKCGGGGNVDNIEEILPLTTVNSAVATQSAGDKKHKNDKNAKKQVQHHDALNTSTSTENVSDDLKQQSAKVKKLKSKKEKKGAKKQQQDHYIKSNVSSISEDNFHTNDKRNASNNTKCKPEHVKATKDKFNAKNTHVTNETDNKKVFFPPISHISRF